MRDPITIGRQHRAPLLPVRRSLNTGYVGRMSNWSGTPRQVTELRERTDRDPESRWWFSHVIAAGAGAAVVLLLMSLNHPL